MRSTTWAAVLAMGYAVLAGSWILVSSSIAAGASASIADVERFETAKGIGFVVVTALALFAAARFALAQIERRGAELLQRQRVLVAAERRVFAGLMASSVAHDANNVLTVVVSELELLEGRVDRATLQRLRASLGKLVELNRRLVQAARHSTVTTMTPLVLAAAVRDAVASVRSHPALRSAAVTIDADDELRVVATPLLIAQIVTNLVINAAEAGHNIEVRVRRDGPRALVAVDDDGPGIPEERREGIFDALATTKAEGNGMGLFSVKATATALGGEVGVGESVAGGASVRVWLPVA